MGCVNSTYTPPRNRNRTRHVDKFKDQYAFKPIIHNKNHPSKHVQVKPKKRVVIVNTNTSTNSGAGEGERVDDKINDVARDINDDKSEEEKKKKMNAIYDVKVEEDEWPKWLVDNISQNVLATLIRKTADSYEKLGKVGRGTYSNVYKARDKESGKIVALKKVRFDTSDSESIKFMAREIMILQTLDHPNVIKLEGLATSRMQYSLYLVFEYMQCDLTRVISRPTERLTESQIKCYMQQLLLGLQYCHERGVMHRDIKASNLLIDKEGVLKIADFGLANSLKIKPKGPLTNRVVTLWYRAPELLLGSTDYDYSIDIWSVGCLLAEMFVGRPIMPGRTEIEQLHMIYKLCGSPSEDYLTKMKLKTSFRPPQRYKASFEENFKDFPLPALNLLTTLLDLHSQHRGTAASALQTEFFKSRPLACDISELPVIINKGDDERSQKKRGKRRKGLKKGQLSKRSASNLSLSGMNQAAEQGKIDSETSKEEKGLGQNMLGQEPETGNSGSSRTSSIFTSERSLNASISPVFLSSSKISPKTEGHPNALKNIKNYTLLQASILDMINPKEGNDFGQFRRSFSTLDFRLDPEKLSSLYGSKMDHEV
ncbi:probable serine/threonine-protein kinase At1g54610 [Vicia villosa]|uniref:probable serine/threonine-protein kinase At1g54610 n=1 Tax=Vicia villosa TaxID=3911 RepID=UPI00273B846F|nr:probable serine/threonine-protein kinase At1g54610 [Vicia villosa]